MKLPSKLILDFKDENDNTVKMIDTGIILDENIDYEKMMKTIIECSKILNPYTKPYNGPFVKKED